MKNTVIQHTALALLCVLMPLSAASTITGRLAPIWQTFSKPETFSSKQRLAAGALLVLAVARWGSNQAAASKCAHEIARLEYQLSLLPTAPETEKISLQPAAKTKAATYIQLIHKEKACMATAEHWRFFWGTVVLAAGWLTWGQKIKSGTGWLAGNAPQVQTAIGSDQLGAAAGAGSEQANGAPRRRSRSAGGGDTRRGTAVPLATQQEMNAHLFVELVGVLKGIKETLVGMVRRPT